MKRISKQVMAGNVKIGGGAPVTVQSMLNVKFGRWKNITPQAACGRRSHWKKPAARFSALPSPIWMPCG